MRPSSRGGGFGYGAGGGAGAVGFGTQTGYGTAVPGVGARPGSALRPGTGSRVGTGRLGTGQAPVYSGVGLNTDVHVADRPVTREGMVGIHQKNQGPGRQVEDLSYYVGLIRKKNTDLESEVTKMKGEIERFHKDSSTYQHLERKYEALIKDVRTLEGQLADYNLAMDKSRTSTDPREIHQYYLSLKQKNEHEANEIDKIFLMRQDKEKRTQQLEGEIAELQRKAAEKMNSLPPRDQEQYRKCVDDNARFQHMINEKQQQLEQMNARINEMEEALRRDPHRDEFARLHKHYGRVDKERHQLREEVRQTELDPAKAREQLLAKAREDNARLLELTDTLKEVQDDIDRKKQVANDLAVDMEERRGEAGDKHKYEVLYQRDEEMTAFIDAFPETKAEQLREQSNTQANIVALLEHISKNMERQHNMPNRAKVGEMQAELSFKSRQRETAETTHARLLKEHAKRTSELNKIDTLDSKISVELSSLNSKIQSMTDEMETLVDIDSLKTQAEQQKALLTNIKARYLRRRDAIRQQVRQLSAEYDRKKATLEENETARGLEALEKKLRSYEQKIFDISEYIATKGKETEYEALQEDCVGLTDDLNAMVIRAQAMTAPSLVQGAPY